MPAVRVAGYDTTNRQLAAFVTWINTYCTARGRPDLVPDVGWRCFRLTTRQFRRTLAWFIARRPGGAIAGALQYRHQSIHLCEGYAGTSDSGFRDEVEAEQALARGHLLAELATEGRIVLTGPAAAEAEQRLADFASRAVFEGRVVTDETRLRRIVARHDPKVYPGAFVTCVYNPDRALCRVPGAGDDPDGPRLADCRPLACRNTALTPGNRTALAAHADELDTALTGGDLLALRTPPPDRAAPADHRIPRPPCPGADVNRPALPDTDTVRTAMDTVLADVAARGRRPTFTAVERHLGLAHATFYRHYRDLITTYFQPRIPRPAAPADDGRPAQAGETTELRLRRLRQENADLRRTVEVYAEAIRQLAVDNAALRQHASTIRALPVRGH